MTTADSHKPKKGRSPSYPGIDLETAIERARVIDQREGTSRAPMAVITGHWGYSSPKTGPAAVTYAALKKFGLLEENGHGEARMGQLTELAFDVLHNPTPKVRYEAIKQAALRPAIHMELWQENSGRLPSDDTLHFDLVKNRGFTRSGATEFIRQFRSTLAFSNLVPGATVKAETDEEIPPETPETPPDPRRRDTRRRRENRVTEADVLTYAVPVAAGTDVTIEGHFPLTEAEWAQFLAVLTAMKPGLVGERSDPAATTVYGDE